MSSGFEDKLSVLYEDEVCKDYSYIPKKDDRIGLVRMAAREVDDGKSDVPMGDPLPNDGAYEESVKNYINGLKQDGSEPVCDTGKTEAPDKAELEPPFKDVPKKKPDPASKKNIKKPGSAEERAASPEAFDIDTEKTSMLGVEESNCYLKSASTGETFYILSNPFVVGRKHDSDLCIAEKVVSGHHAEISELGGRMFLTDLGSTNGTLVDGQVIPKRSMVELHNGTEVVFANKKFKFFM